MLQARPDEPKYAFVPNVPTPETNQWGKEIETVAPNSPLRGDSLRINGDQGVSDNPNRYKQHGFHFTADNCIGCHACEAACSEKNDLPAHISFRSVGYVEGGSYPAYQRLNISMACNHCDDPVCLKGCPTRAYTKFAEYGAVLQDPDICFGCGYCTWVCPYNAPQLDPIEGEVSKCNMCVDRLEVGLKPACAAACLGGALDFGLIETTPENREQAKVQIPGFPDPSITHPNIRFQQTKTLPREMTRTDTMPIRYQRDEQGEDQYKPKPSIKKKPTEWNLSELSSREDPLVLFTLVTQGVVGAFLVLFLGPSFGLPELTFNIAPAMEVVLLFAMIAAQSVALAVSTVHLGKPHRFYRAFNNLRYSPVSREVAAVAVFFGMLGLYAVLKSGLFAFLPDGLVDATAFMVGILGCSAGIVALYCMHKIYRIKARPFWNHWQVLTAFFGSALTLGALIVGWVFGVSSIAAGESYAETLAALAAVVFIGLVIEGVGLRAHASYLNKTGGEAAAAHQEQTTRFGKTYIARNAGLALASGVMLAIAVLGLDGVLGMVVWTLGAAMILGIAVVGRALFYVLVIPTTMPGAFFWRNGGFEKHARTVGLAKMPQTGVLPHTHYHGHQLAKAKRELREDFEKIKKMGWKAVGSTFTRHVRQRWVDTFSKA